MMHRVEVFHVFSFVGRAERLVLLDDLDELSSSRSFTNLQSNDPSDWFVDCIATNITNPRHPNLYLVR